MNSLESIKNPREGIDLEIDKVESEEQDGKNPEKIDLLRVSPVELEGLDRELKKETGISSSVLEKLGKNPRLRKAMAILLLSSGLGFTVLEDAFSQEIKSKSNTEQIDDKAGKTDEADKTDVESPEMREKLVEMKNKFVDFVKGLQEKNIIKYNEGEKKGMMEAVEGNVGKYHIECAFHHYPFGAEKGKITGGKNELFEVTFTDEEGTRYSLDTRSGDLRGLAFNFKEKEGLKKMSREDLATKYGIILGMNKEGKFPEFGYVKDLSPKEIGDIIGDVDKQAGIK